MNDIIVEEIIKSSNEFEIDGALWEEKFEAGRMALKYPNLWIHFSDIPKLGINPKKSHRDPHAIYFYNCKWLIDNYAGFQYGLTKSYYYIANIKTRDKGGINLNTLKYSKAEDIADRNGWLKQFVNTYDNPEKYLSKSPMEKKLWKRKKVGSIFYGTADALANVPEIYGLSKKISWNKLLNGVSYLYDPGFGIIAGDEGRQILVRKKSLIKVVNFGENKNYEKNINHEVSKQVIEKFKGKWKYNKDKIEGDFKFKGAPIHVKFDLDNLKAILTFFSDGMKVTKTIKYDYSWEYPIQSMISTIHYGIEKFLKDYNPTKTGKELFWTVDKMKELTYGISEYPSKSIYFRDFLDKNNGDFTLKAEVGTGNTVIRFTTNKKEELEVYVGNMQDSKYGEFDFEYEKIFKKTTVKKVINDFQNNLAKYILSTSEVKSGKVHPYYVLISLGFNIGGKKGITKENYYKWEKVHE